MPLQLYLSNIKSKNLFRNRTKKRGHSCHVPRMQYSPKRALLADCIRPFAPSPFKETIRARIIQEKKYQPQMIQMKVFIITLKVCSLAVRGLYNSQAVFRLKILFPRFSQAGHFQKNGYIKYFDSPSLLKHLKQVAQS